MIADAVVVGSALVTVIAESLDAGGRASGETVSAVLRRVEGLAGSLVRC